MNADLKLVLKYSKQPMLLIGVDGFIMDINDHAEQLFQHSKQTAIGSHYCEFMQQFGLKLNLQVDAQEVSFTLPSQPEQIIRWSTARCQDRSYIAIGQITAEVASQQTIMLKKILSILPGHVYWKDKNGKALWVNDLQAKTAGFASAEAMIGKDCYDFLPKEQADQIYHNDQNIMSNGKELTLEETAHFPNGQQAIYLSKKIPLQDDDGQSQGIIGISFDITQQKRLEQELLIALKEKQRTENALNTIIATMPGHVYWKDTNGTYLGCNDQPAKSLCLKSGAEIIGKTDFDLPWDPEHAAEFRRNDLRIMQTGLPETIEEKALYNGKICTLLSHKTPLKNTKGEVTGILGVSVDITEQKQRVADLQAAHKRIEITLEHLISIMPGLVYWKDLNGKYLGSNELHAKAAGLRHAKEIIGKTDADLIWKDEAKTLQQFDAQVLNLGEAYTYEETGSSHHGQRTFLTQKTPLVDEQNTIAGVIGISFDITDQKINEQLKKDKQIAEEKAQALKLLAASIAHELRTPLATIDFMSTNLQKIMPLLTHDQSTNATQPCMSKIGHLNKMQREFITTVPQSLLHVTKAANTFIDMMLMKVSPENAKPQTLATLSAAHCIKEILQQYPLNAQESHLIRWQNDHNFYFKGDATLFRHIIFNLLKNALYYLKEAENGAIHIWFERGIDSNKLHFKDTGKGISAKILLHIFDQFYSKTKHGTGVGLALCKVIMKEFNGEISCESIENQYTHFVLTFPLIKNLTSHETENEYLETHAFIKSTETI